MKALIQVHALFKGLKAKQDRYYLDGILNFCCRCRVGPRTFDRTFYQMSCSEPFKVGSESICHWSEESLYGIMSSGASLRSLPDRLSRTKQVQQTLLVAAMHALTGCWLYGSMSCFKMVLYCPEPRNPIVMYVSLNKYFFGFKTYEGHFICFNSGFALSLCDRDRLIMSELLCIISNIDSSQCERDLRNLAGAQFPKTAGLFIF